ncbi:3-ketoacyl-ACP synthase [Lysinibacillus sp. KCTC 33748]|uniref:elongation factor P 5-aminopentanone reductase n=1 Tax=unclassified Lysinibacillus TaxID=2636778 RepID=UPI0009A813AF|nr:MULTISPECIES: SDR family oxidoreductase [unclassified Lysinibacillus]OXS75373.1 3-ketoacyl-ACP synthase [Lysinibacillus sp. KCTC 33748]SKB52135.1 3-oxoacyl-[acyl-carrier protein] reductase [Lysinibacillus sp. AC-3]
MKKFALVLGASGEIGRAICQSLAEDGWSIYIHFSNNEKAAQALYHSLSENFPSQEFMLVQGDFSKASGAQLLASQIFNVQAIVFANGQAHYSLLEDTTVEDMDALWRVHVQNPMRLTALLSSKLRAHDVSYVLFIGSIWGEAGSAGEALYAAVKGAQHAFVKSYAKEAALSRIRVNAIAPGFINTSMNSHLSEEELDYILEDIPLGIAGQTTDVAKMVRFYLSGNADYVTGQVIRLNGGWYI